MRELVPASICGVCSRTELSQAFCQARLLIAKARNMLKVLAALREAHTVLHTRVAPKALFTRHFKPSAYMRGISTNLPMREQTSDLQWHATCGSRLKLQ